MEDQFQNDARINLWKLIRLKGMILLATGLILIFFPKATLTTLIVILGFYWFTDGIVTTIRSLKGRKEHSAWGWGLLTGALGLIAGIIILSQPFLSSILTTAFVMSFIGFTAIVYGISGIITGFRLSKGNSGKSAMILGGLFSVLFGLIVVSEPYISGITIISAIGIIAIIGGITILVVASNIKSSIYKN